jgi:glycosyltransferase involved in cell wall biosynthesis
MKISVITVVRNGAGVISRTLENVERQTWPGTEHIVVDGASADGTADVVRARGRAVTRLISEPDAGIYDALNKGIATSTGDIISILHAADAFANDTVLSRVIERMETDRLDALLGDVEFVSPRDPNRVVRRYRSDRFRPSRLAWGWMPAHPALFVRRSLFERVGPFRTDYRIAGDFEWIIRAFHGGTLRYRHVPEVLVRMMTGGISTAGWRSTLLLNREVLRACRENGISTNWAMVLSKYPLKLLEYVFR